MNRDTTQRRSSGLAAGSGLGTFYPLAGVGLGVLFGAWGCGDDQDRTLAPASDGGAGSSGTSQGGGGDGGGAGDAGAAPAAPLVLQDFEHGPGRQGTDGWRECMTAEFGGVKPALAGALAGAPCDWPGLSANSCETTLYCEGCENLGMCLDYIDRLGSEDEPFAGEYSLRIYESMKNPEEAIECEFNDERRDAYGGVTFWLGDDARRLGRCAGEQGPESVMGYRSLSMQVRAGQAGVDDAELAFQDQNGRETSRLGVLPAQGKVLLSEYAELRQGEWVPVEVPICELLRANDDGVPVLLDAQAIVGVIIGFARGHFEAAGTYTEGIRQLDVDEIVLLPCGSDGCEPCAE